jgi:hypothetical protein
LKKIEPRYGRANSEECFCAARVGRYDAFLITTGAVALVWGEGPNDLVVWNWDHLIKHTIQMNRDAWIVMTPFVLMPNIRSKSEEDDQEEVS